MAKTCMNEPGDGRQNTPTTLRPSTPVALVVVLSGCVTVVAGVSGPAIGTALGLGLVVLGLLTTLLSGHGPS